MGFLAINSFTMKCSFFLIRAYQQGGGSEILTWISNFSLTTIFWSIKSPPELWGCSYPHSSSCFPTCHLGPSPPSWQAVSPGFWFLTTQGSSWIFIKYHGFVSESQTNLMQTLNIFLAVTINQPARVIGIMLSSFFAERFGRKPCLIVGALSQIVSAASIYFCTSYTALMVALSLNGLCVITVMVPSYSLLSEICLIR